MFSSVHRQFVYFHALLAGACLCLSVTPGRALDYSNLRTNNYLGPVEVLATVTGDEVFTEGPAADDGGVLFTNIPASEILR